MAVPTKILSGAQTGADRAALDWAIFRDIPHGGWCPKGRKAEDGKIPPHYQLTETPSASYLQRTEWNVRACTAVVRAKSAVLQMRKRKHFTAGNLAVEVG